MIWSNEEKALIERYRTLIETDVDRAIEKLLEDEDSDTAAKIVLGICLIQSRPIFLNKDEFTNFREVYIKSKTSNSFWLLYKVVDGITRDELGQLKKQFIKDLENYYKFDGSTAQKIVSLAVKGVTI